ncbi:hypothetical protein [Nevskia sp.]|uniref:hypothetical protein n=1 Tax=Nevskia sp. TaxID=1929292 RepID=UPI0025F7F1DD|nr:hypothetical protein [Nevskia sp.]
MIPGLPLETLLVAVIVLAFALRAVHQLFPATSRRVIARVRGLLGMKAAAAVQASGCDAGCGPCGGCGTPKSPASAKEAPLTFERTPKR